MNPIPLPTIERLCRLFSLCMQAEQEGRARISSAGIAAWLGVSADVVRKDLSHVGAVGIVGAGYAIGDLRQALGAALGLEEGASACVVGLGRLGSALLEHKGMRAAGARIVAGFDLSINRLETLRTAVPVYPMYELAEVVRRKNISLGIIAVPAAAAQEIAEKLIGCGVAGILNFASAVIQDAGEGVAVRNVDVANEMRVLSALVRRPRSGAQSG